MWAIRVAVLLLFTAAVLADGEYKDIKPSRVQYSRLQSRISGGLQASSGQFPWEVFVLPEDAGETSYCGGSILTSTWVLTAAHCTYGYVSIDLYFGSVDIYTMTTILTSTYWIEHPDYNPANYNNDLSVIQLPSVLSFNSYIQPINLVPLSQATSTFVGQVTTVLGFGYTSDTDPNMSSDLLYTNVIVIPNSNCTIYYGSSVVTVNTLCAVGYPNLVQSICSGDSGGPMVIANSDGSYTQIGINSFVATTGCTGGTPSGYVRVGAYLSWISAQTGVTLTQ